MGWLLITTKEKQTCIKSHNETLVHYSYDCSVNVTVRLLYLGNLGGEMSVYLICLY